MYVYIYVYIYIYIYNDSSLREDALRLLQRRDLVVAGALAVIVAGVAVLAGRFISYVALYHIRYRICYMIILNKSLLYNMSQYDMMYYIISYCCPCRPAPGRSRTASRR